MVYDALLLLWLMLQDAVSLLKKEEGSRFWDCRRSDTETSQIVVFQILPPVRCVCSCILFLPFILHPIFHLLFNNKLNSNVCPFQITLELSDWWCPSSASLYNFFRVMVQILFKHAWSDDKLCCYLQAPFCTFSRAEWNQLNGYCSTFFFSWKISSL